MSFANYYREVQSFSISGLSFSHIKMLKWEEESPYVLITIPFGSQYIEQKVLNPKFNGEIEVSDIETAYSVLTGSYAINEVTRQRNNVVATATIRKTDMSTVQFNFVNFHVETVGLSETSENPVKEPTYMIKFHCTGVLHQ